MFTPISHRFLQIAFIIATSLCPLANVFAYSPQDERFDELKSVSESTNSDEIRTTKGIQKAVQPTPHKAILDPENVTMFDQLLADHFPADGPGGVALVAKGGEVLYHKSFGLANLEFKISMPLDAKFCIGSITKTITAAGILRLQDQGKLSIEDSISKHLPDYPAHASQVKIKHLLSHTSGIHNYNNFDEPHPPGYFTTEYSDEEFINLFKDIPLDFKPGTRYEYSNSGYSLLGTIIEKVSGKSFDAFLQDEFCKPLKLKNLALIEPRLVVPGRTSSYMATGQSFTTPEAESRTFSKSTGGGIETTAVDLFRFCDSLLTGQILHKKTFETSAQPFVLSDGRHSRTGLGWFIGNLDKSRMLSHDGLTPGYSSSLVVFPDEQVVAIILSNCNWYSAERGRELPSLPHRMAAAVLGKGFGQANSATPEEVDRLPAVYVKENGDKLTITCGQDQLFMQKSGGRRIPLFRMKTDLYYATRSYETLRFKTENSSVVHVALQGSSPGKYHRTTESVPQQSLAQAVLERINSDGVTAGLRLLDQPLDSRKYYLSSSELRRLAARVYQGGDEKTAITILERADKRFPNQDSAAYQAFATTLNKNLAAGENQLRAVAKNNPSKIVEEEINWLGYAFLRQGKTQAAIAFFRTNVTVFPDSWNAHDSLAEAFLAAGQVDHARTHYRRSIRLNPEHWDGMAALKTLLQHEPQSNSRDDHFSHECTLHGKCIGVQNTSIALLRPADDPRHDPYLEYPIVDGEFKATIKLKHPECFMLAFGDEVKTGAYRNMVVFLEPGAKIEMTVYSQAEFEKNKIEGSDLNREHSKYLNDFESRFAEKQRTLWKKQNTLTQSENKHRKALAEFQSKRKGSDSVELQQQVEQLEKQRIQFSNSREELASEYRLANRSIQEWKLKYILEKQSIVSLYLLYDEVLEKGAETEELEAFRRAALKLAKKHQGHPYNTELERLLNVRRVGQRFIDFSAPDLDGNQHQLSDEIQGEVALIDLWATWCGPCIVKTRQMVPVYNDFKNKGFKVVGVAGEFDNTSNLEAFLKREKLPWLNLVELDRQNKIWKKLGISRQGGAKFLVDETGVIVAVDPTANELRLILERHYK